MEWQPIETAPRLVRALVWVDGRQYVATRGRFGWAVTMPVCRSADAVNPTHWMPLPSPPSEA